MEVFEKDGKINFVDENDVFVGFDYQSCCCEHFDWFYSKEVPKVLDIEGPDEFHDNFDPKGWVFDTSFCKEVSGGYEDNWVTFRLVKGKEEVFLVLYNCHNGYYAHGYTMILKGTNLYSSYL